MLAAFVHNIIPSPNSVVEGPGGRTQVQIIVNSTCCSPLSAYSDLLGARVGQNAQGVFEGVIKGVTRALFGRRAPLTPKLKRASAKCREEKYFRGVYMIQQVAAERLCSHPVNTLRSGA